MPFTEQTKREVRKKAAEQCCVCRHFWPEVHHIIPEVQGGSNDIKNAAPLCPNCHTDFGHNPDKIERIRALRDALYQEVAQKKTSPDYVLFTEQLNRVEQKAILIKEDIEHGQQVTQENLEQFKNEMRGMFNFALERLALGDTIPFSNSLATMSSGVLTGGVMSRTYISNCSVCGKFSAVMVDDKCPECAAKELNK